MIIFCRRQEIPTPLTANDAERMSYGNQQIKVGVSSTGNNAANPSVAHTPLKQLEALGQIERRVVGLGSPLQRILTILETVYSDAFPYCFYF